MAPENKFPAAVEDAWSAYNWVVDGQGDYLGIDTGAISVGGDSAGGNLATVVSIMARDAKLNLIWPCRPLLFERNFRKKKARSRSVGQAA